MKLTTITKSLKPRLYPPAAFNFSPFKKRDMLFMRTLIFLISFTTAFTLEVKAIDSLKLEDTYLLYHKKNSDQANKKGLIIYMHGGVSQFKNHPKPIPVPIHSLLEGNDFFLPTFLAEGYDVILPIAHQKYNWLEKGGERYIRSLLEKYSKGYDKIYLAGFSDGGTGAYRLFYTSPELYEGVFVFNGYPQLSNFNKGVDYSLVRNKKVFFFSCRSDQQIPHEFLLVEFRKQQMLNKHTYFRLIDGKHTFKAYQKEAFDKVVAILNKPEKSSAVANDSMLVYPPFDAWLIEGKLIQVYPFRKKIGKAYQMNKVAYQRDDYSFDDYSKQINNKSAILVEPTLVSKEKIGHLKHIEYKLLEDGKPKTIQLINWLNTSVW